MKQPEATHAMKMKWRMIPAMKSSLKATHTIKGNSKEVTQPGERLPENKEGWRQEPWLCSATKAGTAQKTQAYMPSRGMKAQKSDLISAQVIHAL